MTSKPTTHWSLAGVAGRVVSVSASATHTFGKAVTPAISLIAGQGVSGDAHMGSTVKHRSRVAADPTQPNLRQVHLIHADLLDELRNKGFEVRPGDLGENVLTSGIALLDLPRGTLLHLGASAIVEVTGLRNPCHQLDDFQMGLTQAVLDRDPNGRLIRKAGIMGIVRAGGEIRPGDDVSLTLPAAPWQRMDKV